MFPKRYTAGKHQLAKKMIRDNPFAIQGSAEFFVTVWHNGFNDLASNQPATGIPKLPFCLFAKVNRVANAITEEVGTIWNLALVFKDSRLGVIYAANTAPPIVSCCGVYDIAQFLNCR